MKHISILYRGFNYSMEYDSRALIQQSAPDLLAGVYSDYLLDITQSVTDVPTHKSLVAQLDTDAYFLALVDARLARELTKGLSDMVRENKQYQNAYIRAMGERGVRIWKIKLGVPNKINIFNNIATYLKGLLK